MPPKKINNESTKSTKSESAKSAKSTKSESAKPIKPTKSKSVDSSGKILVIVESPGKIKKIQSILGDNYIVTASVGHIIDLSAKTMSIDIKHDFKPNYEYLDGKGKVISELKSLAKMTSDVLLATDEDREGEMIAWSLAYVLGISDAKRICFNSITHDEIMKAVENPRNIDFNLVDAQKGRRMLDRIVGYEISPLLWKSIGQSLSAGRVQSVVVRIILDREREIQNFLKSGNIKSDFKFKAEFYKNIIAQLYQNKPTQNIQLNKNVDDIIEDDEPETELSESAKISGTLMKGCKANILDEKSARELFAKFIQSEFKVSGKGDSIKMRNPSPPFTTSTLQQEAARKLGFTIKRTMMAAQNLYEAGHITYMRTDSTNLSAEAIKTIGDYIKTTYGIDYHNEKKYAAKSKNTQEAHESVRPTHIEVTGLNQSGKIGSDESKLYILIWKRAISSQMSPAKLNVAITQISISKTKDYYFQSELSTILFEGFLKVYNIKNLEEDDEDHIITKLPNVGDKLKLQQLKCEQDYNKPLPRYNEASLVNKLDPKNLNIGRPSTYAAIINKIQERGYVEKKDNVGIEKECITLNWNANDNKIIEDKIMTNIGKDTGKLTPTAIGSLVTDFLVNYFPDIMDYKFTSTMEEKLDGIAEGKMQLLKLMNDFYKTDFHPIIEKLSKDKVKYVDKDRRIVGTDADGNEVIATIRRFGPVIMTEKNGKTVNIAPLKAPLSIESVTLEDAAQILSYPKSLGKYDRKDVKLFKGKFGFYVKYGDKTLNLSKIENEKDITLDKIKELIEEKKSKYLWEGKDGKIEYVILEGPFGKYIRVNDNGKKSAKPVNVKFPEDVEIKDLTLEKIKNIVEEGRKNKFKKFVKK
jgi:DNA topoisomerase-1